MSRNHGMVYVVGFQSKLIQDEIINPIHPIASSQWFQFFTAVIEQYFALPEIPYNAQRTEAPR